MVITVITGRFVELFVTMATPVVVLFLLVVFSLPPESAAKTTNSGFTVDLISVDSPSSPFYNHSATVSSRISQSVKRSLSQYHSLLSSITVASANDFRSPLIAGAGSYMMKLSLGSGHFDTYAVIDTGGHNIWTQCVPCEGCFPQSKPMFDPAKSETYVNLSCTDPLCISPPKTSCDNGCRYSLTYGDGTTTTGALASDIFTFDTNDGSGVSFPVAFGCGHRNHGGSSVGTDYVGVVGLGGGPLSLISQLGSSAKGKFSYCFMDYGDKTYRSVMNFGDLAVVSGDGLVTTPITLFPGKETLYYLTLDDISVGSRKLNIPPGTFHLSRGGFDGLIIDTGVTLTFLKYTGHDIVVAAMKRAITFPLADDTSGHHFELCYKASEDDVIHEFPDVTFHFLGGDVIVGGWNMFLQVEERIACLALLPVTSGGPSIYGNLLQQGFHVGYDLVAKTLSFAHSDCTRM